MNLINPVYVSLLAFLLCPAEPVSAQADTLDGSRPLEARFTLPHFARATATDEKRPFSISKSGDVTFDGRSFTDEEIVAELADLPPAHATASAISIDPHAAFADIVARLAIFSSAGEFKLLDLRKNRTFVEPGSIGELTEPGAPFRGTASEFELPVTIGLARNGEACVATLGDMTITDGAFYHQSFVKLDDLVQREGGVESALAKTNNGLDIVARVQSAPQTPWRCVAAIIHAVEIAGWPVVQLEVSGE
jgi:hypothetical protein